MATNDTFITLTVIPHNKHTIIKYNDYNQTYIGYTPKEAIAKYRDWYTKEISPNEGVENAEILVIN